MIMPAVGIPFAEEFARKTGQADKPRLSQLLRTSSPSDIASKLKKRRYSRLSGADAELAEGLNEGRTIASKVAGPIGSLAGGAVLHGPGSPLVGQMGRSLFK